MLKQKRSRDLSLLKENERTCNVQGQSQKVLVYLVNSLGLQLCSLLIFLHVYINLGSPVKNHFIYFFKKSLMDIYRRYKGP